MVNPIFNIDESKEHLRLEFKQKRASLSFARRKEAALHASKTLFEISRPFKHVLSFASFNHELNTWPLNRLLARQGKLILPKIEEGGLKLYLVRNLHVDLLKNKQGLFEPNPLLCQKIEPQVIDLAFIPGLGFDLLSLHRLGYGKGFYDRLLLQMNANTPLYGVGFKEQSSLSIPSSKHDIPLHCHYLF